MTDRAARVLPLLFCAAAALGQAVLVDRVAASVNDVAIPESAVRRAMLLSPIERAPGESENAFRARVLDALIDQYLEYEDAQRFGPSPPDATEIAAAMKSLRDRLAADGKDPAAEFARAGMTVDDVRAALERQLVVQRYLKERFRSLATVDAERPKAEYEEHYVPERKAAGQPVLPYEQVASEMETRARERIFDEDVEKWIGDLRDRARITIYPTPTAWKGQGTPVVIATAPAAATTPVPGGDGPRPDQPGGQENGRPASR